MNISETYRRLNAPLLPLPAYWNRPWQKPAAPGFPSAV
jgi:hypothetical protein